MVVNARKMKEKYYGKVVNITFSICMVIVASFILQLFVVTSFNIPSDSMEPTLLPGDYILVEKCSKGARLFNIFATLDGKRTAIFRIPGLKNLKRNDVLVFNYPYPKKGEHITFDVMSYYVKRCIALPGDTLEIRKAHYRVRGYNQALGNVEAQFFLHNILISGRAQERGIVVRSYPKNHLFDWSIGEFGPFYIPAKEDVVDMTPRNGVLYKRVIEWEQSKTLKIQDDNTIILGDSIIHRYQFKENYYFVSGDKIANSRDSRYWGLLPESFIVGRAWCIWKSIDRDTNKMRWGRIFKKIE